MAPLIPQEEMKMGRWEGWGGEMGIKGENGEKRGAEKGKECSGDGRQKERWYSWEKKSGGGGVGNSKNKEKKTYDT